MNKKVLDFYKFTIINFYQGMKNFIETGDYEKNKYVVVRNKRLIYLHIPKVATSSIVESITNTGAKDDYMIHTLCRPVSSLTKGQEHYYKFTFVRNPFDRLVSCYESKYHEDRKHLKVLVYLTYDYYLLGYMRKDKGFDNFIHQVCKLPDGMRDLHVKSQYRIVHDKNGKLGVDYIGKYENLEEDYKVIEDKFKVNSLPHFNKSKHGNWKDYYTLETAELVYRTYKLDFETFGYEKAYHELIQYIKEKEGREHAI